MSALQASPHVELVKVQARHGFAERGEIESVGRSGGVMAHSLTPVNSPRGSLRSPRARGGEPPLPETAKPGEVLRCEICNVAVKDGVNGMKIHREGKRHQGMVKLMRL